MINVSEWLLIFSTLAGPVIAVQTQKWIERGTESRRRRRWIFDTLMATRATRLADEHVRALNLIELEFRQPKFTSDKKNSAVTEAWRALFGELTQGLREGEDDPIIIQAWNRRCDDLSVALLRAMSVAIGFSFTNEELRRGIYHPRGHVEREATQHAILNSLKRLLNDETSLQMKVTEIPTDPEVIAAQLAVFHKAIGSYADDGSLRVTTGGDGAKEAKKGL